ncbi:hypothetical protein FOXYS1_4556 [Fusarium oxysporum]|uniref:Metallo-beta-lactamase domain-containing protein n=2 Tax=Fusarium oxysporum TaxID=5507 RepID=A0A8H5AGD6_FUSOX|nr:hypothetical protein FOXYS1_4556 [Fusarium oxysporum]
MSYSYGESAIKQRLDRVAALAPPWVFARPSLQPMNYSLLVQGGEDGYAAVVSGSYNIFDPDAPLSGYLDGLLSGYLLFDANRWNPLLLKTILENNNFTYSKEYDGSDLEMPADLTVVLDPKTHLPYLIRGFEKHPLLGTSTHDLRVYDYILVEGVMIPQHFKTIYNSHQLIVDWVVDEVQERYTNYNYLGPYVGTVDELKAEQSWSDLPGVWVMEQPGYLYRQMLLELQEFVVVLDAPSQQSNDIIKWVDDNIRKPIRMVIPTNHHHDHAMGLPDYVKVGAKVVVPDMAKEYYHGIPNMEAGTFTRENPFILEHDDFRAAIIHMHDNHHAKDHVYAVVMPSCVSTNSIVVVFEADFVISNKALDTNNDHTELWQLIQNMQSHRVSKHAEIVSVHGFLPSLQLSPLLEITGLAYPDFTPSDFKYGVSRC